MSTTAPIRATCGLVISAGAEIRVVSRSGGIAVLAVKVSPKAVDHLRVRVPLASLPVELRGQ